MAGRPRRRNGNDITVEVLPRKEMVRHTGMVLGILFGVEAEPGRWLCTGSGE